MKRQEEISKKHDTRIVSFGHAGDGNIHINVMYDRDVPEETGTGPIRPCTTFLPPALNWGGTISGEHGIGTTKRPLSSTLEISTESLNLQRRIKTAFDPDGIMNPGKIFPAMIRTRYSGIFR